MAASSSKRLAAALLAACAAVAGAQEREKLPIQVESRGGTDFDYSNGVFKFHGITITQGGIRITADSAVANGLEFKDSSWEFSGSVRITMPDSKLASDTASVRFSGGEIASAAITGGPATFEQQRKDEHAEGRANRIDYDLKRGSVELTGDAWLADAGKEITGEKLVYSMTNQRVVSQAPVVITIQPGEAPKTETPPKPKADP
jgi:lipopolysaccharide export system protein LptA